LLERQRKGGTRKVPTGSVLKKRRKTTGKKTKRKGPSVRTGLGRKKKKSAKGAPGWEGLGGGGKKRHGGQRKWAHKLKRFFARTEKGGEKLNGLLKHPQWKGGLF